MEKSVLDGFRLAVAEKNLHPYGIKVEKKNGDSVTHFWRSDDKVNLYSASKTFTSLAVGMCEEDGRLKLTDKVMDYFPEYRDCAAPGSGDIALRDLLHMASGKTEFWFGALDGEMNSKDWAELFFRVPVSQKPGTYFLYSNACTYMLGRVIEKVSGRNVRNFLLPRLFTPIGIENPQWEADPAGHTVCASGLLLALDEFSRLGRIFMEDGEYQGKRIIGADYLHRMHTDVIDNSNHGGGWEKESSSGYGYQVWSCSLPGTFRADGMYGQFCILFPKLETAVTITSHEEKDAYGLVRAVFDEILPRLS